MAEAAENNQRSSRKNLPVPKGKLLSIGGKEDKGEQKTEVQADMKHFIDLEILGRFVKELPGREPMVALVPTASTEPVAAVQDYRKVFEKLKLKNIEVVDIRNRLDTRKPEYAKIIEQAAGIMFTGGDQLRLTAILGGTPILHLMKERYTFDPIIVGGTSAGAAAMSTPMIYEGETQGGMIKGDVRITTGLEFLKDVAIDTHFISRGRIIRMSQAIATNPSCIGIGLEEDTAILVSEGRNLEILGNGLVTVLDGMESTDTNIYKIGNGEPFTIRNLKIHLLGRGEKFVLPLFDQLHI
ncbi:cyanophycinase [Adhaeribacter aerolatus]|uniref:Cyanophycinase n=1 Tax=Adhaeribacter aerolatus TaxID=670289 RepID=A0A512AYM2_9BACT|nr:cyanophycinase [Adhaeribacter aerolatus]GEO04813.1 cyanophycinase [Adhaeribacter aerolatus]